MNTYDVCNYVALSGSSQTIGTVHHPTRSSFCLTTVYT